MSMKRPYNVVGVGPPWLRLRVWAGAGAADAVEVSATVSAVGAATLLDTTYICELSTTPWELKAPSLSTLPLKTKDVYDRI